MKIEKCPFCGSEAETFEASEDSFSILCTGCGVETPYLPYLTEAIAAWNRRVDARQLALKTRVCPMCEDCPDGCPVETPKDSRNIVTNADRIRSMSDEELAAWLVDATVCERVCGEDEYCHGNECVKRVTDWLQQPAKEEHHEAD